MPVPPFLLVEQRVIADIWEAWRDLGGHEANLGRGHQQRRAERVNMFLRSLAEGRPVPAHLYSERK